MLLDCLMINPWHLSLPWIYHYHRVRGSVAKKTGGEEMKECGRCRKECIWGSESWSPGRPISQATESVHAFPSEGFSRRSPSIQKVLISDSYFHG